jgi:mannose/fructose/N-acetylgalactosamine-specific phosphotransferase system component IID
MFLHMDAVVRYVLATLLAVVGGGVGYSFVPLEPFGVVGNVLFVGALFGLFAGLFGFTGFFGNVVNGFLLSFPLWFLLPGGWFVVWTAGNVGYAVGNVFGQLARLSAAKKIEAKAL